MSRQKNFTRADVLEKSLLVFWSRGYSATTIQDLEKATGVNKSGLYSEFKNKDDLFVKCLQHCMESNEAVRILTELPLGWTNIENFLKFPHKPAEMRGCFAVNSVREYQIIPEGAKKLLQAQNAKMRDFILNNIKAAGVKKEAEIAVDFVLTFNSGLCLEQNVGICEDIMNRKITNLLSVLKEFE